MSINLRVRHLLGLILCASLVACGGGGSSSSSAPPLDSDGDGLPDEEEITLGTRIDTADTDLDQLSDYDEVKQYFTDPLKGDSDEDGLLDGMEVALFGTDPLKEDTDSDGFNDKSEIDGDTDPVNFYSNATSSATLRFTLPIDLSVSDGHSYAPSIAIAPDGNPHVVYHDNVAGGMDVYYLYSENFGDTYTPPVNISKTPGIAEFAEVALDSKGNVYAVWKDNTDGTSNIYFSKRPSGQDAVFGSPQNIFKAPSLSDEDLISSGRIASSPDVEVGSSGRVVVAWYQENALVVVYSDDEGQSFSFLGSVEGDEVVLRADVAVDSENDVHLVFERSGAFQRQVFYSRSIEGEFTAAQRISNETIGGNSPRVATDSNNNVFVVWSEFGVDGGNEEIRIARSRDKGNSFETLDAISKSEGISVMPDLAVSAADLLYVTWQDTSPGNFETLVSVSSDSGDTFSEGLNIAPSETGSLIATLAVNDREQVFVTWDDNRFGPFEAVANRGEVGQPAVAQAELSTLVFTPNGDGVHDALDIQAYATEPLIWTVEIWKVDESEKIVGRVDRVVRLYRSGLDAGLTVENLAVWDGLDVDGVLAEEGAYYVIVTGETSNGLIPVSKRIDFTLLLAQASDLPVIESFETSEEVFAPDADGRADSIRFSGSFNKEVSWQLAIKDANEALLFEAAGQGQSVFAAWDGTDLMQNLLGEGIYTVSLEAQDSLGNEVSDSLEVRIDLDAPVVTDIEISPSVISPGDEDGVDDFANISFYISEGAVVTVFVYQGENLLIKELYRESIPEAGVVDGIVWDGTTGDVDSEKLVDPGHYTVKIWVRDFAANRYEEYPILRTIEVVGLESE